MKKITLLLIFLFNIMFIQNIGAKKIIPIFYGNGEKYSKVYELPKTISSEETHFDIAVACKQFSLFWLPVWNYGEPRYVLLNERKHVVYELDADTTAKMCEAYGLNLKPSIPWGQRIGLKPLFIIIILVLVFGTILQHRDQKRSDKLELARMAREAGEAQYWCEMQTKTKALDEVGAKTENIDEVKFRSYSSLTKK